MRGEISMINNYDQSYIWNLINFDSNVKTVSFNSLFEKAEELLSEINPLCGFLYNMPSRDKDEFIKTAIQDALIQWEIRSNESILDIKGYEEISDKIRDPIHEEYEEETVDTDPHRIKNTIKNFEKIHGFNKTHLRLDANSNKISINKYTFYYLKALFAAGYELDILNFKLPLYGKNRSLIAYDTSLSHITKLEYEKDIRYCVYYNLFLKEFPLDIAMELPKLFDSEMYNSLFCKKYIYSLFDMPLVNYRKSEIKYISQLLNDFIDLQITQNDLKATINSHREDALCSLEEEKNIDKITIELIDFENDYISIQDQVTITEIKIEKWYQRTTKLSLIVYPILVQGLIEVLEVSNTSMNHHIYEELEESMEYKTDLLYDLLDELYDWKNNHPNSKIPNYEYKITKIIDEFKTFNYYAKINNKLENEKLKLLNQNECTDLVNDLIIKKIFSCHEYALNQINI
jgi:hypothetical protein